MAAPTPECQYGRRQPPQFGTRQAAERLRGCPVQALLGRGCSAGMARSQSSQVCNDSWRWGSV